MKVQAKVAIGLLNSNKIEAWISIDQPYGSDWQTANGVIPYEGERCIAANKIRADHFKYCKGLGIWLN